MVAEGGAMIPVLFGVDEFATRRISGRGRSVRLWLTLLIITVIAGSMLQSTPAAAGVNSWTSIGPDGGSIIALEAAAGSVALYAATVEDVFASADGGATWQRRSDGLASRQIYDLLLAPGTSSTLYAGTDEGVFKSTDGGLTWAQRNQGLGFGSVDALAIVPSAPNTLYALMFTATYKSTDGAATWSQISSSFDASPLGLTVDPSNPAVLYAGSYTGVHKSSDGGGTWVPANTGLPADTRVYEIAVDPANPSTLL
jgi:photosystem II stability/assembly factor-like uncharacterized protein